jgi:allantoicase
MLVTEHPGAKSCHAAALKGDAHNQFPNRGRASRHASSTANFPGRRRGALAAYGDVVADWDRLRQRGDVDLAAAEHGGLVVECSDMFFGSRHNLIMPGDATHMGDGWETKRRRGPGHDWTVVRLAAKGTVRRVEVDTRHFKGNAPGACSLEASTDGSTWTELLSRTPLSPHTQHSFEDQIRRYETSHTSGSIFFRMVASDACGCLGGRHNPRHIEWAV